MAYVKPPPRIVIAGATGWFGKTLVHEYALSYGSKAAADNLLLYASRQKSLTLNVNNDSLTLPVAHLAEARYRCLEDYDGFVWYSFILRNKLSTIGYEAYKLANESIAAHVFGCLNANPHLRTIFISSGAALSYSDCPKYEADPYAYLKISFERELAKRSSLVTLYPYATLGIFVPDHQTFAAASFIYQACMHRRIVIEAKMPVVRSYGSVHDFTRLILHLFEQKDWTCDGFPKSIVPVTHTLELNQLAQEVAAALGGNIDIISSTHADAPANIYMASDFSYGAWLRHFGLSPTDLSQQLRHMSEGSVFL